MNLQCTVSSNTISIVSVLRRLKQKDYKVQGQPATEENPVEYREREELGGGTSRRKESLGHVLGNLILFLCFLVFMRSTALLCHVLPIMIFSLK